MPATIHPQAAGPGGAPSREDPLVTLADRCVQCGLCLPACPTYGRDRIEAESPRGRIALARAWARGTIEPGPLGDAHMDHCLGCRSCEAVCPAGVDYGPLLAITRTRQRQRRRPGWRQRLAEALLARPQRLSRLLALYRMLHPALPATWRPVPRPPPRIPAGPRPDAPAPQVALFIGCIATAYEAPLRGAVARLCGALGIGVTEPAGQGCCGSLHAHAGDATRASALAAANREALSDSRTVLTLASGCHEAVGQAMAGAAAVEVVDAIAYLEQRADRLRFRACTQRVALHLPCTQRNVVGSDLPLLRLLARIEGLDVVRLDAGSGCCGAAGIQMLADPERATGYRQPLLDQLDASGANCVLSANIGCRLHLANGTPVPILHPLEFLAGLLDARPPARP